MATHLNASRTADSWRILASIATSEAQRLGRDSWEAGAVTLAARRSVLALRGRAQPPNHVSLVRLHDQLIVPAATAVLDVSLPHA